MNTINCYVTKILSSPYFKYEHWWLDVEFESYGTVGKTKLMFTTKEEADAVEIGYEFLE